MDRYLSSGKYRPQMLHAQELRIQLPASERSFLFAEKVRTLMLGEDDKTVIGTGRAEVQSQRQQSVMLGTGTPEPNMVAPSPRSITMQDDGDDRARLEVGADEGLVSRYIKILEIYNKVIKWSCAGGRRSVIKFSVRQFPESHADNHIGWKSILHGIRSQNLLSSAIYVMNSRPTSHDNTHLHRKTPRHTSASKHQRLTSSFIRSTYYVRSCSTGNTYHSSQSDAPSPMGPSIPRHSLQTNTTYLLASGTKARATVSSRPARLWIWCEHVRSGVLSSRRLL